ncbi:MAG: TolC family protein, partial [Phocaeicola sp.]
MLFVAIALTRAGSIYGQDRKWTLEECINQAIAHNIVTKQSQNEINNLKVEQSSIKNSLLPNLNAGASQRFAFGRSLNQNNTYENSNIQSSSFSISTEMNLFAGFRTTTSISQKKMDILAAEANKELIENNLSLNVTSAYYQILLDKEIYSIAQQQIVLTKEQAYRTELLIESGKVAQAQLFDIKAQLADDELTATEAKNQLSISLLELIQLMELEGDGAFDIDSLDEDIVVMNELNPAA